MLSYQQSLKIVQDHLKQMPIERSPAELFRPIEYILSIGGKRIRPCLTLMAHSLFSDSYQNIIQPAIGIEVFHNFTLMHDDIMDKALKRRNFDTVHAKWNDNVAILSGDAMLILAYQLISETRADVLPDILKLFNQTALEVCEGQQYDMNFESILEVNVDEYLEMIRLKTAVLIAASLALGGIVAKTHEANVDALYQLGLNIGLAFQLQDDYLDVYADESKFGKAIGNDILANKKTYLLLSALQSDEQVLVDELKSWISKNNYDATEKIKAVIDIYRKLEIGEKTLKISRSYFSKGINCLEKLDVPSEQKTELHQLVNMLMNREH